MTYDEVTRFTPRKHTRMSRLQVRNHRLGRPRHRHNRIYSMALVIWREKRHELLAKITRQKLTIVEWKRVVAEKDAEIQALKAQLDRFIRAD